MTLRIRHWTLLLLATLLWGWGAVSVQGQPRLSKKGGFLFPIKPGQPASLPGNMGELRSNHFHGGLDVRTGWASGQPVLASKEGYISRIFMAGEGYGNTVFITHPDGFVTVYAHLERLLEPWHSVVKKQQYEQKLFEVDLNFKKGAFKVKQGDTIAISGNTGSSRGPHLHFEIRDTAGMVYNPLFFGFPEIKDNLTPVVDRLALVPLETDARVNGTFQRKEILVREAGKEFIALETPRISGTVGLEIKARDRINNSTSNAGIYCIEMFLDGKLVYYHNMYQFPIQKTHHVNQLMNYRHFRLTAEKFQKLYGADGYFQTRNIPLSEHGKIRLPAGAKGDLEIVVWDAHGNKRICRVSLQSVPFTPAPAAGSVKTATRIQHEVLDNTLMLKLNGESGLDYGLDAFFKGRTERLAPAYREGNEWVFLYDLRKGLPDSVRGGGGLKKAFSFVGMLVPGQPYHLSLPDIGITFKEDVLFDTLYLESQHRDDGTYQLSSSLVPLADYLTVSVPCAGCREPLPSRYRGYAEALSGVYNKSLYSECREGNLFFISKYLGNFKIQKDSTAPVIRMGVCNSSWARFNVYDNLSGIDKVEATLNGEWLLMVPDKKKHLLYAEPWPSQLPMKGEFRLKVTDKSGNTSVFTRKL